MNILNIYLLRKIGLILLLLMLMQYALTNATKWGFSKRIASKLQLKSTVQSTLNYRLPKSIIPTNYNLQIISYLDEISDPKMQFTFRGRVNITLKIIEKTKTVTLHAKEIRIKNVRVEHCKKNAITIKKISYINETDFLIINTSENLNKGLIYFLTADFYGSLKNDNFVGFYLSSYVSNGRKIYIATTHFETTHARRVFPCFDEPAMKASFEISINHRADYNAVSNMPLEQKVKLNNGRFVSKFQKTPPMSSYLVAFVLSDFDVICNRNKTHCVWTKKSLIEYAKVCLEISEITMKALENFLQIPYKMPKIDHLAIPDFNFVGMENWGLIIYKEQWFIFDPNAASTRQKQFLFELIAHEISHQWFGNLVSPKLWSFTWLNEGFASYLEHIIVDLVLKKLSPKSNWRIYDQFALNYRQYGGFEIDETIAKAITSNVSSSKEIAEMFNQISYLKAGSIIFMFQHIFGTKIFFRGLTYYLKEMAYASASPDNLWDNLQRAYNEAQSSTLKDITVKKLGDIWSKSPKYPIVICKRFSNGIVLSQIKFNDYLNTKKLSNWIIPINFITESTLELVNNTTPAYWLTNSPLIVNISNFNEKSMVIVNNLQTGYYRVLYDEAGWEKLTFFLSIDSNREKIPKVTLAQLINDALTFSKFGYLPYEISLNFIKFLEREIDFIPWKSAVDEFERLDLFLMKLESYKRYQLRLIETAYKQIDSNFIGGNDNHIGKLHKSMIIRRACTFGLNQCREIFLDEFPFVLSALSTAFTNNHVHPDIQFTFYCTGMQNATEVLYRQLWNRYYQTDKLNEKTNILQGFGCMENNNLISMHLKRITNSMLENDSNLNAIAFNSVINNGKAYSEDGELISRKLGLSYFITKFNEIYDTLGFRFAVLAMNNLGNVLTNENEKNQFEKLEYKILNNISYEKLQESYRKSSDNIRTNILWYKIYGNEIEKWLEKNGGSSIRNSHFVFLIYIIVMSIYF